MTIFRVFLLGALHTALCVHASGPRTAIFDVDGMACRLCEAKVKKALDGTPGVLEAKADRAKKRAEVKYDPDRVTPDGLAEVIARSGFKPLLKR